MLIGLRTRKTRYLLLWIIFFLLCVFPEAGIVLYMAVYYWVRQSRKPPKDVVKQQLLSFVRCCLSEWWHLRHHRVVVLGPQSTDKREFHFLPKAEEPHSRPSERVIRRERNVRITFATHNWVKIPFILTACLRKMSCDFFTYHELHVRGYMCRVHVLLTQKRLPKREKTTFHGLQKSPQSS